MQKNNFTENIFLKTFICLGHSGQNCGKRQHFHDRRAEEQIALFEAHANYLNFRSLRNHSEATNDFKGKFGSFRSRFGGQKKEKEQKGEGRKKEGKVDYGRRR
jgi:hypothetical protein